MHPSHERQLRNALIMLTLLVAGVIAACALPGGQGIAGYAPLHTLLETIAVVIAVMVFAVGWNAHKRELPSNILLIGVCFLGVGLLDFSHLISFDGMPDFVTPSGVEKAIDFWLAARALAAVGLLWVAVMPWRPFSHGGTRYVLLGVVFAGVGVTNWLVLFHPDAIPHTFVPGLGLTTLKIVGEYSLIAINLITAFVLWQRMQTPQAFNAAALFGAVCAMALSEYFFTLYANATDVFNLMGHIYKVVSYLFLFRAIFVETIEDPYQKLALAQKSLSLAMSELRQKNAELERFTYAISHDLKSPLVTVKTFLGYLKQDMAQTNAERIEKDMGYITKAADKMGQLLDELLQFSQANLVASPPTRMNWREPLDEALTMTAGAISQRNVEVDLEMPAASLALVAERARLVQIWQNLIDNAVKFMGDQAQPRLRIGVQLQGQEHVFFVCDNGMGVDSRYREKIFGLFERLDPNMAGSGLGLALAKRIVERYGGRIWLESEGPGKGACVRFTLPRAFNKEMDKGKEAQDA